MRKIYPPSQCKFPLWIKVKILMSLKGTGTLGKGLDLRVVVLETPPASKWLWGLPSLDPCPRYMS